MNTTVLRRSLVIAGLALSLATCRDAFEPGATASIAVAPILPAASDLAAFGLTIDGVRFIVVRPPSDTLADTTVALPPDASELAIDIRVPVLTSHDSVRITVMALSGTLPLFAGTRLVPVPTPLPPPEIPLDTYLGPAVDSIVIQPRTPFILLSDSLRLQVQGFNAGAPVSQLYVAWSTSDSGLARINPLGVLRAPGSRSAVRVRARTPSGAVDSVTATFTPAATQLLGLAGGGQLDTVGQLLATPLEVQARAADGLGVGGVPVRFRALSGGGSVTDSVVMTDSAGRARTTVTLGGLLGGQTFEAAAPGLSPVTFSIVALAGPAAQLLAIAGDGLLATVATVLGIRPAVRLKDAAGNPVAGASVAFAVSGGGGSLTGGPQLTNAAGVATVGSWTLGTLAGPNSLTATAPGVAPAVFTATGVAGVATTIVKVVGDLQSAIVNTIVPFTPQVRILDQFGNPVSGTTVSAAIPLGGGSVTNSAPVSDSSGNASVGNWRLGTLVGANELTVSAAGLAGSPITFTATGLVDVASQMVAFGGDAQAALVGNPVSINPAVRVSDGYGNSVGNVAVTFTVGLGGGSVGTPFTVTSDTGGIARASTWTLGLVAGLNTLDATATGLPAVTFNADGIASLASSIAVQAGTGQIGTVGAALPSAYSVIVKDLAGVPVAGVPVSWGVASGGGSITPALDTTDATGTSTAVRTLGAGAGTQTATASVGGLSGSPVFFSSTALAGAATRFVKQSLDPQTGTVATGVVAPVVKITDQFGNGVSGVIVDFSVAGGGALGAVKDISDPAGLVTAGTWTLGALVGSNTVTATSGTLPAVTFSATSVAGASAKLTFVVEPTHGVAGNVMAPVHVAIEDQFGNHVRSAQDFVTLQFVPGSNPVANLQGTAGATAVDGVARFDNFFIDAQSLGNRLDATAGVLTGTSSPFAVGGVVDSVKDDRLNPIAAAFSASTRLVYIPGVNNTISVFDPSKRLITPFSILQNQPFGVAVNDPTNRIYVTTFTLLVGAVTVLDSRDPSAILGVTPLAGPARGIAVDAVADRIFVAVEGDAEGINPPTLAIIDGKDSRVIASIPFPQGIPAGVGVAFNSNDGLVYVAIPTLGVAVFDPTGVKFKELISIVSDKGAAGTYGVAVDVRTNLVYATNRDENTVSVIDPAGVKEITRLAVGRAPEGLGVDADRGMVYVGNSGEATVSFIDGGILAVVATLVVGPAPKAAAVNPLTGQVYVPTFADDQIRVVQP